MFKKKKIRKLAIISATFIAGIAALAVAMPAAAYKYNYDRYIETNSDQVFEISNNKSRIIAAEPSDDSSYYKIENDDTVDNPNAGDSINFGDITKMVLWNNYENISSLYNNSTLNSILNDYKSYFWRTWGTSNFDSYLAAVSFFANIGYVGASSSLYSDVGYEDYNDSLVYVYRNNSGFYIYPSENFDGAQELIRLKSPYTFTFKNQPSDPGTLNPDSNGDMGGIYKGDLGGHPGIIDYSALYNNPVNASKYTNSSLTGFTSYDINGNPLSKFYNTGFVYKENKGNSGIKYKFSFIPNQWNFVNLTNNTTETWSTTEQQKFYFSKDFSFLNYLSDNNKTDAYSFNSVSVSVVTNYRNYNLAQTGSKQYVYPRIGYSFPSKEAISANDINAVVGENGNIRMQNLHNYKDVQYFSSALNNDSTSTYRTNGVRWGDTYVMNVTYSLTPILISISENKNSGSIFSGVGFIPLPYSGTTKIRISANVENADKAYTPYDYVVKALYAKRPESGTIAGDDDADFKVSMSNGYPGCQYGSENRLIVNNTAGTVTWRYDPGSVLKNGLIYKSTESDIKEITIGGFKRIPGVTKIASSINLQSPYTIAQDLAKDKYRLYKSIYDLGITNIPDITVQIPDWDSTTLENLEKIMKVENITYNNIGEKTSEGYPNGGYVECEVSLYTYFDKNTNLVEISRNKPSEKQTVLLYGLKHVEPTIVPADYNYVGDSSITAQEAITSTYESNLKLSIMNVLTTPITPSAENDWRSTVGGTLPVTESVPDFSKQISFIDKKANNIDGTVKVTLILNTYYAGADENGVLKTSGFQPVEITISGFKKVQQTKLNSSLTVVSDKTASEAIEQSFSSSGASQYPYIQYILTKYKNDAFTGLPDTFFAGSIQVDDAIADDINGTVTAQISVLTYFDESGNLFNQNLGNTSARPLGTIVIKGFKKVVPTSLLSDVISVTGNLEFYNTLASQVDETKLTSVIFDNKDTLFSSYPGLHFSINSIKIKSFTADNLAGTITLKIALSRYYDDKGRYIDAESDESLWLDFNREIKIIGFVQVKPTEFVTTKFDQNFKPDVSSSSVEAKTASTNKLTDLTSFLDQNNTSKVTLLGGSDQTQAYEVTKNNGQISLVAPERSAWEILGLSSKTIFQVSPSDLSSFISRSLLYAGSANYGINIKTSDIGIKIITSRNPDAIVNTSNKSLYEDEKWYTGSLEIELTINMADGVFTKKINFKGTKDSGKNIFNRYIPIPVFVSGQGGEKNLATNFTGTEIEQFVFQNIDTILNGSLTSTVASGKPVNFSQFNISISNIFYNNNKGEIQFTLTIDNIYLPSGNLSTNPDPAVDGTNPTKSISTVIVFSGFKQQNSTEFRGEINLTDFGAINPIDSSLKFPDITAEEFWNSFTNQDVNTSNYSRQNFVYDLIMGNGALWPEGSNANTNRILNPGAELPDDFNIDNIISVNATYSNINGKLSLTFKIDNYYDLYGNLETSTPKIVTLNIFGFKKTQSSIIAGSAISADNIKENTIYIKGSYDLAASLVTNDYIIKNIISDTSGLWPEIDITSLSSTWDTVWLDNITNLQIVSSNNSTGVVKATFFLNEDIQIYDADGNLKTLTKGNYTIVISGFESSLMLYVWLSISILFVLLVLIPAIIIIIKQSRLKTANSAKIKDYLK